MKKTYMEPVMVVEDFTVSKMVAKCELITKNTFVQQISAQRPVCAVNSGGNNKVWAHQLISSFNEGTGDFDNKDKDFDYTTNNGEAETDTNRSCFLKELRTNTFCTWVADDMAFADYPQTASYTVQIPACTKDSGSTVLQNS